MKNGKIGVGIVGANAGHGWGRNAHIPALRLLADDFEIRAISTNHADTAAEAAAAFGISNAFGDFRDMVRQPEVDLVTVAVRVPHHLEIVEAALAAGKHVYCEWPLGIDLAEATRMAEFARKTGRTGFIGLQARASTVIDKVSELLAQGYVGKVLSTSVIGSGMVWGGVMEARNEYLLTKANGGTMLSIPVGHMIDAFCTTLGEFTSLNATAAVRRDRSIVLPDKEVSNDVDDQILIQGTLESGATASVHYRGGISRGTNMHWEVNGTEGDLIVRGGSGMLQMSRFELFGAQGKQASVEPIALPIDALSALSVDAENVARLYAKVAKDLREGSQLAPRFEDAVARHKMLDHVAKAAESGKRETLAGS